MWIRTQDKKELVNVIRVKIYHFRITEKDKGKITVLGEISRKRLLSSNEVLLGAYTTMEEAIAELDAIENTFLNNPNGIHHMKNS